MGSSKTQYYLHFVIIYTYNFDNLLFPHLGSNDRLMEPQYVETSIDIIGIMTIRFVSFQ